MWWLPREKARRSWARRAMKATGSGPVRFAFGEEGMSIESQASEHQLPWTALTRWLESEHALLVYAGPTLIVVPKRAFVVGQLEVVRALLSSRIEHQAGGVAFLTAWHFSSSEAPPHPPAPNPADFGANR
jgi:hypothetical protein